MEIPEVPATFRKLKQTIPPLPLLRVPAEMKARAGEIVIILWQRRYILQPTRDYPKMFGVAESSAAETDTAKVAKVQVIIDSPLAMYELMDGKTVS